MRRAGRRGGRRVDGQPVVGSEPLDAGDVAEQGGTTVAGRGRRLLGTGQVAAGRAVHDDGRVGGRRYAMVAAAAGGHLQHRGTTGFDDDLGVNAAAAVRHEADAAGSGSDTTAAVTFLVHHCGRVRFARYHAWTIAAGHGVLLQPLAAAVRPLRAAPPRDGARYNDVVTVVRVTITALMHVRALLHDTQRLLLAVVASLPVL